VRGGLLGCVAATVLVSGCSAAPIPPNSTMFPETIKFNNDALARASYWTRNGISAVTYVAAGETLSAESRMVGAIISSEHLTATDLMKWMRKESIRSGEQLYHDSGESEEWCKVGADPPRLFVAVAACKTGVQRAACVELDEPLDSSTLSACHPGSTAGCSDICDQQWLAWGEALDLFTADVLTIR
jgi:hypothetical protein